jgi:hypothetical protein
LKDGTVEAGISMISPVEGLRPVRAPRSLLSKVPKPTNCTLSPAAMVSAMVSIVALTALSASFLDRPVRFATSAISFVHVVVLSS